MARQPTSQNIRQRHNEIVSVRSIHTAEISQTTRQRHSINTGMNEAEYAMINSLAEEFGVSKAQVLRMALHGLYVAHGRYVKATSTTDSSA
jgi:hypothetical protein